MCVKGNGRKRKSKKSIKRRFGIPPLKKGELTKHGYQNVKKLGVRVRRKALTSAIKEYGAPKNIKKIRSSKNIS